MARVAFKQSDVERLLRAAKRMGHDHPAVAKRPDGTLVLLTVPPADALAPAVGSEDGLDAELEAFRRKHGDG